MLQILDAEKFIALVLKDREKIHLNELFELRRKIQEADHEVIIDISGPALDDTLSRYWDVFQKDGPYIRWIRGQREIYQESFLGSVTEYPMEIPS